jgi:predicted N-acyltransferase
MGLKSKLSEITRTLTARHQLRRELRGPAELHYAIADSIALLDAPTWNTLACDAGFFLSRDYLLAMESVLPHNISPQYAIVSQRVDGTLIPMAAVYMQLADISLAQVGKAPQINDAGRAITPVGKLVTQAAQRILCCGNLLSFGQHGIAFAKNIDVHTAWHGVAEVLYRVRQADRLRGKTHFVMIKDLHSPFEESATVLQELSYREVETEPNMVLDLDPEWKSYDDYLGGLASKYRANIRNGILKPIEAKGFTVERVRDLQSQRERLFELYKSVQMNASFRPFELRSDYFAALERVAGERLRCSAIRDGSRMIGFLITLAESDETAIAYHVGFDRDAAVDSPVYLRLLHAAIEDAIDLGCKRVSFGRTALEPKAALGAKPQAFAVLVRHRQPLLNKLLKHLLLGIEHAEAPERNPFKKSA